jgi:hypothetical protein
MSPKALHKNAETRKQFYQKQKRQKYLFPTFELN